MLSQNRDTHPKPRDAAVDAAIALLAETWPACFCVYERRRRPLQLGIRQDVLAGLGGAMTEQELRRALRYYTGNAWYLRASIAGTMRVDLNGSPACAVSAEEAAVAVGRLAARQRRRQAPPAPTPAPPNPLPVPKRIGLADLRQAAQLRKDRRRPRRPQARNSKMTSEHTVMTGKTPMVALIACSNINTANAVAGALDAFGYAVDVLDLIDDVDPHSCAVFLKARCVGGSVDEVFRRVDYIARRYAASCVDVGPGGGREGVSANKRASWRHALAQRRILLKELTAKLDAITAYHEAGHVIAGYQTGSRLGYGGVRIFDTADADGVEGQTLFHTGAVTEKSGMIRNLGGPVAEAKYRGVESCVAYAEIKKNLQHFREDHFSVNCRCTAFVDCFYLSRSSDDLNITHGILTTHPCISDQAVLRLVRYYEAKTIALIDQHWASVERIAASLIRRRQLSHSDVLRLLPGYDR